jgi:hypothetical protein
MRSYNKVGWLFSLRFPDTSIGFQSSLIILHTMVRFISKTVRTQHRMRYLPQGAATERCDKYH